MAARKEMMESLLKANSMNIDGMGFLIDVASFFSNQFVNEYLFVRFRGREKCSDICVSLTVKNCIGDKQWLFIGKVRKPFNE